MYMMKQKSRKIAGEGKLKPEQQHELQFILRLPFLLCLHMFLLYIYIWIDIDFFFFSLIIKVLSIPSLIECMFIVKLIFSMILISY